MMQQIATVTVYDVKLWITELSVCAVMVSQILSCDSVCRAIPLSVEYLETAIFWIYFKDVKRFWADVRISDCVLVDDSYGEIEKLSDGEKSPRGSIDGKDENSAPDIGPDIDGDDPNNSMIQRRATENKDAKKKVGEEQTYEFTMDKSQKE